MNDEQPPTLHTRHAVYVRATTPQYGSGATCNITVKQRRSTDLVVRWRVRYEIQQAQ